MNMLIGVICEVVARVTEGEKQSEAIKMVKADILSMLLALDKDKNGLIPEAELAGVFTSRYALETLKDLNVDPRSVAHKLTMEYHSKDGLRVAEILETILQMRGDRIPDMADMIAESAFNNWHVCRILDARMDCMMDELMKLLAEKPDFAAFGAMRCQVQDSAAV